MCLSSSERGGPRRCSGDTLRAYEEAIGGVATLEREAMQLRAELADDPHAAVNDASAAQVDRPAAPMLFADKEGRVEKIRAEIDRAVEELGSAQMWQDYLEVAGKFPTRSFGNQILILKQMPEATMVCGAGKWRNEHNRTIRKGSKAIWIQAPMSRKVVDPVTGEEERKVFGFKPVPVYDVSQTEVTRCLSRLLARLTWRVRRRREWSTTFVRRWIGGGFRCPMRTWGPRSKGSRPLIRSGW